MKHQLNEKDYKLLKRWMAKRGVKEYSVMFRSGKSSCSYHNEGYWTKFFEDKIKEVN